MLAIYILDTFDMKSFNSTNKEGWKVKNRGLNAYGGVYICIYIKLRRVYI